MLAVFDMIQVMKNVLTQKRILITGLVGLNIVYFSFVSPRGADPAVLFGGFLLLAADIYSVFRLVGRVVGMVTGRSRRSRRPTFVATCICVLLFALQSIGQLSIKDAAAFVIIGFIALFYSSYHRSNSKA